MAKKDEVILVLSDMHIPYEHEDNLDFLKAVSEKYKPTRVVCIGDEIDSHAMSFHPSDPDLPSAGDELKLAIERLQPYYKLFPKVDVLHSNHGSMKARKAKFHGIAMKYLKSDREVIDAPKGWSWHNDLVITMNSGQKVYFHHGLQRNGLALAKSMGMSVVQGHFHTTFDIQYGSSPFQLFWAMSVGCVIDDRARAFEYNKVTGPRPIIGHGMIVNGLPKLMPMILNSKHRWIGVVP